MMPRIGKKRLQEILKEGYNDHSRSKPVGFFRTTSKGSWDNLTWGKNDVGHHSKPITDRHGFASIYVRFKGDKTSRVIPQSVFRKYFKKVKSMEATPEKWATADKGGTKIEKKKRSKLQMTKAEIEKEAKKATSTLKKEGFEMENEEINNLEIAGNIVDAASQKNAAQFQELVGAELASRVDAVLDRAKLEVASNFGKPSEDTSDETINTDETPNNESGE